MSDDGVGASRRADPRLDGMRSTVPGVAWPPVTVGPAGAVAALLRQLDRSQWLAPDVIAAAQFAQLRVLARHLAATSPQFARRLRAARLAPEDLGTPDGLRALPPLRRRDVQDAGAGLFATEIPVGHNPIAEKRSSGSTGEPVVIRHTAINGIFWSALTVRDHLWRGIDFRTRIAACRVRSGGAAARTDWGRPVASLFETGPSLVVPITRPVEEIAHHLLAFDPHILQIYPSVVGPLLDHLARHRDPLGNLQVVHTVGETLPPDTRTSVVADLGVPVWDSYTSEEVGNIAFECPDAGGYHVNAESLLVEILDEDDRPCTEAEPGRVVVTDLHNFVTPLVRYDLGDYAEVGGPCPCGRGLPTVRRVLGRHRNLVLLPDGTRHWPVVGMYRFRDVAPVRQFRFVQRHRESIDVDMVVDRPVTATEEALLTGLIHEGLGHCFELRFSWWDEPLPRQPGGKFEEFRCEV